MYHGGPAWLDVDHEDRKREHKELWGSHRRAFDFNSGVICRLSDLTPFVA
jgi:hypothetical protein